MTLHRPIVVLSGLALLLLAGCTECYEDPDLCPTTEERICTRLAECGALEGSYDDCLRRLQGTEAPLDPVRCESCLSSTECDRLASCDDGPCL